MFAYCENSPVIHCDVFGQAKKKVTKTTQLSLIPSRKNVYIIYYSRKKGKAAGGFKAQAEALYNCKNVSSITYKEVTTKRDFINAWNAIPKKTHHVFLLLHGEKGTLEFKDGSMSSFSYLKKKSIIEKLWLFSCSGGSGGSKSTAAKLAKITVGTIVYALNTGLSYSIQDGILQGYYYARPKTGKKGYWKYFRYYYNSRGKLVYASDYLYH